MNRCDDDATPTTTGAKTPCDCEGCRGGDLPVNPFVALRVAYGMLLGEDDFRVLMGSPRGKQMLHSAWLHGTGVVWGYEVTRSGVWDVKVSAGLALDGIGRELINEATQCLDVRDLVSSKPKQTEQDCSSWTVEACLVAEFDSCLTAPVPTLADPCDVTRKHDDFSRVVERARLSFRPGCCPRPVRPYHRIRVLLGLADVGTDDPAGQQALAGRRKAAAAAPDERAEVLVHVFRRLAALDAAELRPASESGDCFLTLFPVTEEESAVVLACVEIDVRERDGCPEITDVRIDSAVRTTLLPTATIQELACGLAAGLITDDRGHDDAGGPRVIGERVELSSDGRRLVLPVTAALARGSVPGSVGITSLSADKAGGWVVEDIYDTKYDEGQQAIVVDLADRPVNHLVRVVVRGTGAKPVMGAAPPVPLAGLVGGPPGNEHDGHDAVWTFDHVVAAQDDSDKEAGR